MERNPSSCLSCFMSHRGDSGQKKMPSMRTKDGMKAEPNCRRQALSPTSLTMTLAAKPRKMPAGKKGVLATWLVTRGGDNNNNNNNNDDGRRARRTGHDPELPEHDEGAASPGRGHLGRVDGHRGVLGADADAHDEPGGEEALPRLGKGRPDGRCRETGGRDEDLASAA